MDDATEAAIAELGRLRDELSGLHEGYPYSEEHSRWTFNVRHALERYFGATSDLARGFAGLNWSIPAGTIIHGAHPAGIEGAKAELRRKAYQEQLYTARGVLSAAIDRVEANGVTIADSARPGLFDRTLGSLRRPVGAPEANRRIFISHGGEPPALTKVEEIVRACGFEPVVVGKEASKGMSVDQLVRERMRECCCAIILATRDPDAPESGSPRGNVLQEAGMAQEIFENKIIYLLEKGVEFPSNLRPKVYESFGADNFEPLWSKIVKELRAFEFMQ